MNYRNYNYNNNNNNGLVVSSVLLMHVGLGL